MDYHVYDEDNVFVCICNNHHEHVGIIVVHRVVTQKSLRLLEVSKRTDTLRISNDFTIKRRVLLFYNLTGKQRKIIRDQLDITMDPHARTWHGSVVLGGLLTKLQ